MIRRTWTFSLSVGVVVCGVAHDTYKYPIYCLLVYMCKSIRLPIDLSRLPFAASTTKKRATTTHQMGRLCARQQLWMRVTAIVCWRCVVRFYVYGRASASNTQIHSIPLWETHLRRMCTTFVMCGKKSFTIGIKHSLLFVAGKFHHASRRFHRMRWHSIKTFRAVFFRQFYTVFHLHIELFVCLGDLYEIRTLNLNILKKPTKYTRSDESAARTQIDKQQRRHFVFRCSGCVCLSLCGWAHIISHLSTWMPNIKTKTQLQYMILFK